MKPDNSTIGRTPRSLEVVATSMCAVLYAIGSYLTSYIPSPWGFGQFRPAVIVPSFFAIIFGPMPAAVGAAMGTLIADSVKHGYLYPGSLLAAVPGNFVGFYLFGYIIKKKFTWGRFVFASNLALTIANLIVAFLYVFVFKVLYANALNLPFEALTFLSIGLTIWWFVTMLPFVLLVTPILVEVTVRALPSIVSADLRTYSLRKELPRTTFSLSLLMPGIIMLLIGLISTSYADFGKLFSLSGAALTVTQVLFYGSGGILIALGIIIYAGRIFLWRELPEKKPEMQHE